MDLKRFDDGKFWDLFGRGLVYLPENERPTTKEVADFVISLFIKLDNKDKEIAAARHEEKCSKQQFKVFAMEVSNLAHKYTPI